MWSGASGNFTIWRRELSWVDSILEYIWSSPFTLHTPHPLDSHIISHLIRHIMFAAMSHWMNGRKWASTQTKANNDIIGFSSRKWAINIILENRLDYIMWESCNLQFFQHVGVTKSINFFFLVFRWLHHTCSRFTMRVRRLWIEVTTFIVTSHPTY